MVRRRARLGDEGRVLAWLLADPAAVEAHVAALVDTATDVLRFLVARSGGESLIDRPRIAPVSRPLRRVLLAALNRIGAVHLVEDMRRHRRAWIVAGERLHPGEYAHRWPAVALALAVLRDTKLNVHPSAPGRRRITTYCGVPSNSVLTPRRISNKVGGQAAKNPMINPTWIMSQNTGLLGRRVSWKTRKCISASQPNRANSKTDTVSRSVLKNFRIAAHVLRPPV